jgi:alpha-tubulin suppressor-like RCC1 family protein
VPGDHRLTAVAGDSCALDTAGKAWCWATDDTGALSNPQPVPGGHTFTQITETQSHACALDDKGQAWCWGDNRAGQLGDGSTAEKTEESPVAVTGGHTFTTISTGTSHTCALDTTGSPWCWGEGVALGDEDPSQANKATPVAVITQLP